MDIVNVLCPNTQVLLARRVSDTLIAEGPAGIVGMAQLDPAAARLRALFVAGSTQGSGLGSALLACIERLGQARGLTRLHGAMSLNAVPFYAQAGYRPCGGTDRLIRSGVVVPVTPMEKTLPPLRLRESR